MNATAFEMPMASAPDAGTASQPNSMPAGSSQSLRRSGHRPLKFTGQQLAMVMSFQVGTPFWFEINLYRTSSQGFVIHNKLFYKSDDEIDHFSVIECDSFEGMMDQLENFDAAKLVRVTPPQNPAEMSLIELTATALEARAVAQEARRQYGELVGQLLHELAR